MGGLNFDDEVEPWRAGGDNSRMGQPVIRYGPCRPSVSQRQMSEMRTILHQAQRKRHFEKIMDAFHDPTISAKTKKELFKSLLGPGRLEFKEYGSLLYRSGTGMALSYKFRKWPDYLFDFSEEFIVILKNVTGKEYEEVERFPIAAIRMSIGTRRDEENPLEEILSMHATHDLSYYPNASFDSSGL